MPQTGSTASVCSAAEAGACCLCRHATSSARIATAISSWLEGPRSRPAGAADPCECFLVEPGFAQRGEDCSPAARARDEADVAGGRSERRLERPSSSRPMVAITTASAPAESSRDPPADAAREVGERARPPGSRRALRERLGELRLDQHLHRAFGRAGRLSDDDALGHVTRRAGAADPTSRGRPSASALEASRTTAGSGTPRRSSRSTRPSARDERAIARSRGGRSHDPHHGGERVGLALAGEAARLDEHVGGRAHSARPTSASACHTLSEVTRHVDVANAGVRERVDDRVDVRGRRADRGRLADALRPDRMVRRGRDGLAELELRASPRRSAAGSP